MPSFALEDPEIFNSVLPWSMVTHEPAENTRAVPRNSAKLLQEKVVITVLNISRGLSLSGTPICMTVSLY